MASFSFACPGCDKVLRTSVKPTAGKKIRCPACGETFVPEMDEEENAIQDVPRVKSKSKAPTKTNANDEDAAPSRKKAKRSDPDDGEDEEDAPPAKKKKKGKDDKKPGSKMTLILLTAGGAALLVSVGLCGVGAFVWPGFLVSSPPEKKIAQNPPPKVEEKKPPEKKSEEKPPEKKLPVIVADNLAAFIPVGSPYLIGVNVKQLRDANQLESLIQSMESVPGGTKMPDALRAISAGADRLLAGSMPTAGKPKVIVAILLTDAAVATRLKKMPEFGAENKLNGKYSVFRPDAKAELSPVIAFPSDRVLVMTDLDDKELGALLDTAAQNPPNTSQAGMLAKSVDQASLWGAWSFDNEARGLLNVPPNNFTKGNKELELAIQAIGKAKGATLSANPAKGTAWDLRVNIECADATDAKSLKDGAEAARVLLGFFVGANKELPPTLSRDLGTLAIQNQAATTSLSMQVSIESITGFGMKKDAGPKKEPKGPPPKGTSVQPPKAVLQSTSGPPSKPGLNYEIDIAPGVANERAFTLKGGKVGIVKVGCEFLPGESTEMHIYVLKGEAGDDVFASQVQGGPGPRLQFTPPAGMDAVYRVRVFNSGTATPKSCVVSFIQIP